MHLFQVLFLMVVVAIITSDTLVSAAEQKMSLASFTSDDALGEGRFLRAEETAGGHHSLFTHSSAKGATDDEERGILSSISKKLSEVKTKVSNSAKSKFWVEAGLSDDAVKQKLGLKGLTGAELKNHKNYKLYQKFTYKAEGKVLDQLFYSGTSPSKLWEKLQLETSSLSATQLTNLKNTDEFQVYMRYARKYDSEIYWNKGGMFQPPIHKGGYPAELSAKAEMWANLKRPRWYVKEMLGLDDVAKSAIKSHENYKYYLEFVKLANKTP